MRAILLSVVAVLTALLGAQGTTVNPVQVFRSPILGEGKKVDQATWSIGHAAFYFSGTRAPILVEGRPVGFALEGQGRLDLVSAFAQEAPILQANFAAWTRGKAVTGKDGLELSIAFNRARITWLGAPLRSIDGPTGPNLASMIEILGARFRNLSAHDPFQLQALQTSNSPERPLVIAELESNTQRWVYLFDGFLKMEESLTLLQPDDSKIPAFRDLLHPIRISRQSIGWNPVKESLPPPFLINHLEVDLKTADNHNAEVSVRESITPLTEGQRLLRFRLTDELRTDKDTRRIVVRRVQDENGQSLPFDHANNLLVVQLPAPTAKGQTIRLRFDYQGDFLIQPGGDNYWELPVRGGWYPESEALSGESYSFHGTVRTPKDWIAFLPGDTVRREKEGIWNVVETRTDRPICFATILGGKYYLEEEKQDGLTLRIATYAHKPGVGSKVLKDQTFNTIRYYQEFLGPFPFPEFLIVEKNAWGYGQAPPGMMYITSEAFNQHTGWAMFFRQNLRKRFAHEIAHQYWGIVVKMPSPEEQWLTESFAEYCAGLYERDFKSEDRYRQNLSMWFGMAKDATDKGPIPLANDLRLQSPYETFKARNQLLYNKGPVLLAALHKELGDQVFLTFLKSAQTNFRWKFTTTYRMFDLLKFITKKDYAPFLEKYYWGLDLPNIGDQVKASTP